MKNLFKKISVQIIAALLLLTGGYIGYNPESVFGAFQPVGGTTYRLQSSVGLANTSLTLSSFKSRSGIPWTMSMLDTDIVYATIDPQTSSSEFVSFTGIVQNPNGTATITGLTRGLSDFYPFTASSTMQRPHAGQAVFIISDAPQLFNEYAAKRNNTVFSGFVEFTSGVGFDVAATSSDECTGSTEYCTKAYIDAGLNQGAATSTETNIGLVELSTNTEIAAGTASSSATGPLVPPNKFFNATQTSCNSIACIPVAVSGKISQLFLNLTQHFIFTSIFATSASTTNATTTNQWITGGAPGLLKLNDNLQVVKASTSTDYQAQRRTLSSNTDITQNGAGFATSTVRLTVPAGLITASSTIVVKGNLYCDAEAGNPVTCNAYLRTSAGVTIASLGVSASAADIRNTNFEFLVFSNNSVSAQIWQSYGDAANGAGAVTTVTTEGTAAINFASATELLMVVQAGPTGNPDNANITSHSITVEP